MPKFKFGVQRVLGKRYSVLNFTNAEFVHKVRIAHFTSETS